MGTAVPWSGIPGPNHNILIKPANMGLLINMNKIKTFTNNKKGRITPTKTSSRSANGRPPKTPSILIREMEKEDNVHVCRLLYAHFRSLTVPAIVYWLVQHVYDLIAIVIINACLLSIYNLFYFCILFIIYLFIRARYEIEKHIKESCPDLVDVYKTYRTHKTSNFWVAYVSEDQPTEEEQTEPAKEADPETKPVEEAEKSPERPGLFRSVKLNMRRHVTEVNEVNFSRTCEPNEILGCVGLTSYRHRPTVAQMVRLVVTKKRRNMKVGTKLLEHLETKAQEMGYKEIRVYTNNLNTAYLQFLKQHNFQIIQIVRRGLMRGDLIVWSKYLNHDETSNQINMALFANATFIPE